VRIMPDTNVIISALLWPDSKPARALAHAALYHELLLCDHIVQEVREVVRRKWPHLLKDADALLDELAYDLLAAPQEAKRSIADPKDQPILNAAVAGRVDVVITSDRHFLEARLDCPRAMTPSEYCDTHDLS